MNQIRKRIYDHLLERIAGGELDIDDRLPTEMELASQFGTNRMNAHLAVKELECEGIVRRLKRRGTFVESVDRAKESSATRGTSGDRVCLLASPSHSTNIHWTHTTITEMENGLNGRGFVMTHRRFPEYGDHQALRETLSEINRTSARSLLIFPDRGETKMILKNLDLLLEYRGDIILYNRGVGPLEEWPFHSICLNPFGEGLLAAKFLRERGHQNVVFFRENQPRRKYSIEQRSKGLELGMKLVSGGTMGVEMWRLAPRKVVEKLRERLAENGQKITLVAPRDSFAADLLDAAGSKGIKAPDDFQLLSFDNNPAYQSRNITTVSPPIDRIATVFIDAVCDMDDLRKYGDKLSITVDSTTVIERKTCG